MPKGPSTAVTSLQQSAFHKSSFAPKLAATTTSPSVKAAVAPRPSSLPSAILPVKAVLSPSPAMTPSPMMVSPAPSPIPSPSHTPQTTASMPHAQPHYPPGPSVQYGAHPAPQAQSAPYPSQLLMSGYAACPIFVKLVKDQKFSRICLEGNETIETFKSKLFALYSTDVIVEYNDEVGDLITILSTDDVQHMMQMAQKNTDGLFRLIVSTTAVPSSSSHVAPSFSGVGFPSTLPPSSSPFGSGPLPSYPSHPPPSLPPHGAPPQSLTPLPVEQRTFQTSHFKRFYAAAHVPEFQHVVFADLMAIIKWDCERRNINVKGEGTTFFQVLHFYAKRYF